MNQNRISVILVKFKSESVNLLQETNNEGEDLCELFGNIKTAKDTKILI